MQKNDTPRFCPQCGSRLEPHQKKYCSRLCAVYSRVVNPDIPEPNPSGLCMCGCGERTKIAKLSDTKDGILAGKPLRYVKGHAIRVNNPTRGKVSPRKILGDGYLVNLETGCWEWQYAKDHKGYAMRSNPGRSQYVHRCMYEDVKGPIPDGYQIDHLCRNPGCINPEHLEAVTSTENTRRGRSTSLTKSDVQEIRALAKTNTTRQLADRYGMTYQGIYGVITRKTWKDVEDAA